MNKQQTFTANTTKNKKKVKQK